MVVLALRSDLVSWSIRIRIVILHFSQKVGKYVAMLVDLANGRM